MSDKVPFFSSALGIFVVNFTLSALVVRWTINQQRRLSKREKQIQSSAHGNGGEKPVHLDDDLGDEFKEEEMALEANGGARAWTLDDGPFKMVLVVNMGLKMGRGKVVAQCCHATLGSYKLSQRHCPTAVRGWEEMGQAKICVKCPTEAEMHEIQTKAQEAGLITYFVMDAGRTQIAAGSRTVLAIGPSPVWVFQNISSHLKLM